MGGAGFSLVELLVIVVILAVLAAIAIPVFLGFRARADRSATQSYAYDVRLTVTALLTEGKSTVYQRNVGCVGCPAYWAAAQTHVSNGLEAAAEGGTLVAYGGSIRGYRNPTSQKQSVVNWGSPPNAAYMPPALWITNSTAYRYSRFPNRSATVMTRLVGAIIVNFNTATGRIEIFWVDEDGTKSDSVSYVPMG